MEFIEYLKDEEIPYRIEKGGIIVNSGIDLSYSKVDKLPDNLTIWGNLYIGSNPIEFSDNLNIINDCYIYVKDYRSISYIPDNIKDRVMILFKNVFILKDKIIIGYRKKKTSEWKEFFKGKNFIVSVPENEIKEIYRNKQDFYKAVKIQNKLFKPKKKINLITIFKNIFVYLYKYKI